MVYRPLTLIPSRAPSEWLIAAHQHANLSGNGSALAQFPNRERS